VTVTREDRNTTSFDVIVRIDAPAEVEYYAQGGLLRMVLRHMLGR
jgi:aconitate hydratase